MKISKAIFLSLILALTFSASLQAQVLAVLAASGSAGGGGGGNPTLVIASCQPLGANGGTTSSINTSGANFIVVSVFGFATGAPWAVTENKGNGAATDLTNYPQSSASDVRISYWTNPTVGSGHTFTVTGASSFSGVCVAAYSGMVTSSVLDSGTDVGTSSGTTTCQAGSITPSSGKKVVIAAMAGNSATATDSIDSSYVQDGDVALSGGVNFAGSIAHLIQTPNGSATNPTWTSPSTGIACAIAAFKGA